MRGGLYLTDVRGVVRGHHDGVVHQMLGYDPPAVIAY